ncbi:FAD-dependent monooxygenase [Coraliomargarita parva]|uniref:FAD-dependent monooxygenase n=1 Tax=Coraliomargarita parva TaxID=3014050 RepID=UPI0022B2C943|nr:FAD-dependent monooxygenase [Coraliomargarita parva]
MFNKKHTDVVVLGAGPVGLTAAHVLADRGIDFTLLDRERHTNTHSYALALHPETLELMDQLGIIEPILDEALKLKRAAIFDDHNRQQGVIDYGELPLKYPYLAVIGQNELEAILVDTLADKGHNPMWNHRVRNIEQTREEVQLSVDRLIEGMTGYAVAHMEMQVDKVLDYHANYLIAADGFDSPTRHSAGIDFKEIAPALDYAVFEFQTNIKLPMEMRMIVEEDKTHIFWPLPDGRCRFSFQMEPGFAQNSSFNKDHSLIDERAQSAPELSNAHLDELLHRHAPWFIGSSSDVKWRAMVHFESRLAERFGQGRLWLAGDAAHMARPAGVLSMNVGMHEGADLAERIGLDREDEARQFRLQAYNVDRQDDWRRLLGMGHHSTGSEAATAWLKCHRESLIGNIPASGESLPEVLKQLHLTDAA